MIPFSAEASCSVLTRVLADKHPPTSRVLGWRPVQRSPDASARWRGELSLAANTMRLHHRQGQNASAVGTSSSNWAVPTWCCRFADEDFGGAVSSETLLCNEMMCFYEALAFDVGTHLYFEG